MHRGVPLGSLSKRAPRAIATDLNTNVLVSAPLINLQTVSNSANPSAALTNASWSSVGLFVQTRPASNRYRSEYKCSCLRSAHQPSDGFELGESFSRVDECIVEFRWALCPNAPREQSLQI